MIQIPIQYEEMDALFAATIGAGHRSIAITSSLHDEGVSMLSYALARRIAASGRRSLLVDLNTERPSVTRRLGLEGVGWSPDDGTATSSITELVGTNMSVLSVPAGTSAIMQLKDARVMSDMIRQWSEQYDNVVLDTSPLARINQSNVLPDLVSGCCDASVLMVLAGHTPETKVAESIVRLVKSGANVIGTVLNDRYCPTLASELSREAARLERWLPALVKKLQEKFRSSAFLNQNI